MNNRPLEYCFLCGNPTERAGQSDDSIYCDECDTGPYCQKCFDEHHKGNEYASKLTRADALAEACIIKTENAYSECAICHETWHPADPEIHLENCALAAYREETK